MRFGTSKSFEGIVRASSEKVNRDKVKLPMSATFSSWVFLHKRFRDLNILIKHTLRSKTKCAI